MHTRRRNNMKTEIKYCYACAHQIKGYCVKAIELFGEEINISKHRACEHFIQNTSKIRIKVPTRTISLISGVTHIYRDKHGLLTAIYTDNSCESAHSKDTQDVFDSTNFFTVIRYIQEYNKMLEL